MISLKNTDKTKPVDTNVNMKEKYLISKGIDAFFTEVYSIGKFVILFIKEAFTPPFEPRELINQCYQIGYRSLALISVTGFIIGAVFTKQSRPSLEEFGATSWLPSLVGIAFVKALAPLVTALICAGKVGSGIGAELGSMRVSEQIDAIEMSGTDPFKYLVVTRVMATTFMIPILVFYMGMIAMMGSFVNVSVNEHTSFTTFISTAMVNINFSDYASSITKAIVYGFTIGIMSCYKGYHTTGGTEGVGRAANTSVVLPMFLIFIEEVFIVQTFNWLKHV